jgi:16S rRNA (adenine1518-N6/adenine1519-N6)-dimethyltransferase
MPYRISEIRSLLGSLGVSPKKSLSQNFLIDGNILDKIVQFSGVAAGELVVEIGPGLGALTEKLLEHGCHVFAIEKDRLFARLLEERNLPNLRVFCCDVLEFPFREHLFSKVKVVGNFPYQITTPIFQKIFDHSDLFESCTCMIQHEVALRCLAKPKTKECGSLTLFSNYYATPKWGFFVSNSCFYPVPKVGSAVIKLEIGKKYAVDDEEAFFKTTRLAFCHKRKMLTSSLRELYLQPQIVQALTKANLSVETRPQELSIEEWVSLFKNLHCFL